MRRLYKNPKVRALTDAAEIVIEDLFSLFFNEENSEDKDSMKHLRSVADKIAGLTDSSAVKLHKQFFLIRSYGQTLYFEVNDVRLNRTVSIGKVHYVVQRGHNGSDIFV